MTSLICSWLHRPTESVLETVFGCNLRTPKYSCKSHYLKFTLYNSLGYTGGVELDFNLLDPGPYFNPHLPMKVILHGFEGGLRIFNPTYLIRDAYLQQTNSTVLVVDWSRLSTLPCYLVAIYNTRYVGDCTGRLLVAMEKYNPSFEARQAHVIGFSMGTQAASQASRTVERLTGNKLARVTGLDPRQSESFRSNGFSWIIEPNVADLVDVIYTANGDQGREKMKGNVEFYVNGGSEQQQCTQSLVSGVCNHLTAPGFFAESITSPTGFFGVPCPGLDEYKAGRCPNDQPERLPMGDRCCPERSLGRYYVTTNPRPPYALG